MQLHDAALTIKDLKATNVMSMKKDPSEHFDVREKKSSNGSLVIMNPVASGDNVAMGLKTHKEELPPLVPCCEGKELRINEELVRTGLSAISVKHDSVGQCLSLSRATERLQIPPGLVKHRNSFRSLHRPDLKRVPYLRRMSPDELETLFKGYAELPQCYIKNDNCPEKKKQPPPVEDVEQTQEHNNKSVLDKTDESTVILHPIPETRSGAEDVPAGMRLHGARARLYTSVLAGAKAGDQLDAISVTEIDHKVHLEDPVPEDEVQLNEELQIILPPKCDDVMADSNTTTTSGNSTS